LKLTQTPPFWHVDGQIAERKLWWREEMNRENLRSWQTLPLYPVVQLQVLGAIHVDKCWHVGEQIAKDKQVLYERGGRTLTIITKCAIPTGCTITNIWINTNAIDTRW
jgi:hypothetical protein